MKVSNKKAPVSGFKYLSKVGEVEEYLLSSNGLRVLYQNRPETSVITTNITYLVGARDEARGETGVAHMLEHMLFKPTSTDIKAGFKSSGRTMEFERGTGAILNANTWKDRTTYYFSYPAKYFAEVLEMEADRMHNVVLTDKSLAPERNNVLSEFDMYGGDPYFALAVQMSNTAFHSHPYGHETIGFREDIEDYTAEKLERFYQNYYRPDNAVLMIVGDIDLKTALTEVKKHFSKLKKPTTKIPRFSIREPKQEGIRRITVERPSSTNLVAIGFKHAGFPSKDWFVTNLMLDVLAGGPEGIINKLLVDSGLASSVSGSVEPSSEVSLGSLFISLSPNQKHEEIENLVITELKKINLVTLKSLVTKAKAKMITEELFGRTNSLNIVSELTEYVSARNLAAYGETPAILNSITPKDVADCITKNFTKANLTIGYFIGNK